MELDFVRALGIKVIEIDDFGRLAQYLPDSRILLVDANLDDEQRESISCHLLGRLLEGQAA